MDLQMKAGALSLDIGERRATLRHSGDSVQSWPVVAVDSLSSARAADLAASAEGLLLVERAAPSALALLRDAGVSYVTRGGEWHLVDPPGLLVVKAADREVSVAPSPNRPLGRGAARIARWLLLHPEGAAATISDLARATGVSQATSSRSVRHLAERDLVTVEAATDARRRSVTVRDRAGLLDAFAGESPWPGARRATWDVGAHSADEALSLIGRAAKGLDRYAIGELAGAALVRRLVEPAIVVLWIPGDDLVAWRDALVAQPARPASGRIAVRLAPDPIVLDWGPRIDGLQVADVAQLYVDCHHAGERAIDAAEALRSEVLGS